MSKSSSARATASDVQESRPLQALARVGFIVNGVLHVLIGAIALVVAFGGSGEASEHGALSQLASSPGGDIMLWVVTIGFWALALFQILETALERGTDKKAWQRRAREGGKALAYGALGFAAFEFARGAASGGKEAQTLSATILAAPGGVFLLFGVAVVTAAIGGYFIWKGVSRAFTSDIAMPAGDLKKGTIRAGTIGYVAQGVAIIVVGVLFGVAAVTSDPSEATGLDGALKSLAELPFGPVILTVVALGLIAFGFYCFVRARYARL
jgi:hypothetical protein